MIENLVRGVCIWLIILAAATMSEPYNNYCYKFLLVISTIYLLCGLILHFKHDAIVAERVVNLTEHPNRGRLHVTLMYTNAATMIMLFGYLGWYYIAFCWVVYIVANDSVVENVKRLRKGVSDDF